MRRLFLVRHCESSGPQDAAPLTAVGHTQALHLSDYLQTLDVELLVSSPYTRAQQSIAPFAQRRGLPVEIEPRLAERRLSAAPLENWREAIRQTFVDLDFAWPGGESSRIAMARGRTAIDALLARPARVVVVATHGNLMTLILRSFAAEFDYSAWERLTNPDVYCVTVSTDRVHVARTWVPRPA